MNKGLIVKVGSPFSTLKKEYVNFKTYLMQVKVFYFSGRGFGLYMMKSPDLHFVKVVRAINKKLKRNIRLKTSGKGIILVVLILGALFGR